MIHSSAELKKMARMALNGKWKKAVLFSLLTMLITGGLSAITTVFDSPTTLTGSIIYWAASIIVALISGLFSAGSAYFYLNICRGREFSYSDLFAAFRMSPDRFLISSLITSCVSLISTLPVYLWTPTSEAELITYSLIVSLSALIGSIASLIISLFFALSHYLLVDFQELGAIDSLRMSAYLMKGNKGRYFYITLSFMGWVFLSIFTLGIGLLWIEPYMNMTFVYFYENVLTVTNQKQRAAEMEQETVMYENDIPKEVNNTPEDDFINE